LALRSWLMLLAVGAFLIIGVLQLQFDLLGRVWPGECRTTLCCPDCPAIGVARIIDGDTFDSPQGRVRLYGVDTPERDEACYREAGNRLSRLAGSRVRVEPGPRATDPFGRVLFYVYTSRGESIDEILVREGLGRAWTADGQHRDLLVDLEEQARQQGEGCLWGR
jgi:endonuclease YncB( thermonuclease family)